MTTIENAQKIISDVCLTFNEHPEKVLSKDRHGILPTCRHLISALIYTHVPELSLSETALFVNISYSTVWISIQKTKDNYLFNKSFRNIIDNSKIKDKVLFIVNDGVPYKPFSKRQKYLIN